jgi:hypothetical protein
MVKMGILSEANVKAWRSGQVPYLERVVAGSLGKTSRILRIIGLLARDGHLPPAPPHAAGSIKCKGKSLRFSKTGDSGLEEAYKRVWGLPAKLLAKHAAERLEAGHARGNGEARGA